MKSSSYQTPVRSIRRRRDSGRLAPARGPSRTAAATASTRKRAPSTVGAELDRSLGVGLGGVQVAEAEGDQRPQRGDRHDRQRGAPARARARMSSAPRSAASRPSAAPSTPSASSAQFSPRCGSSGRPGRHRPFGEIAHRCRRSQVDGVVHRERGERRRLQHVLRGARRGRAARRSSPRPAAPRRGRGGADAEQRDLELSRGRLSGRQPRLGAAQHRRHPRRRARRRRASRQLDRGRGDRVRIVRLLDDLRERCDGLGRPRARVRLTELQQHGGALAVGGGSSSARASRAPRRPRRRARALRGRRRGAGRRPRRRPPARCA